MMKYKNVAAALLISALLMNFGSCNDGAAVSESGGDAVSTAEGVSSLYDASIKLMDGSCVCDGEGVIADAGSVTITAGGSYYINGELEGSITVVVGEEDDIYLTLESVSVVNPSGAALDIVSGKNVYITLAEGSTNRIVSGSECEIVTIPADSAETSDASGGALYAVCDLFITGEGALEVGGYINNGIQSSNDITLSTADITVKAVNNGIKGKDSVTVESGKLTITAGGDGIKSDKTDDSSKGWVLLSGGVIDITCGGDGAQAETLLTVENGDITVLAGGGNTYAAAHASDNFGFKGGAFGEMTAKPDNFDEWLNNSDASDEIKAWLSSLSGDGFSAAAQSPEGFEEWVSAQSGLSDEIRSYLEMLVKMASRTDTFTFRGDNSKGDMTPPDGATIPDNMTPPNGTTASDTTAETAVSSKGLKSAGELAISGGTINIDSADDSVHANGSIAISGGTLTLASGDDGIHSDLALTIDDGNITVTTSYEGLEGETVTVNGGNIDITAADDGVNAASDTGSPHYIQNGGKVVIRAGGDGVDSNRDLTVNGGELYISATPNGADSAIDYGSELGGVAKVNGGVIAGFGSSAMAESFEEGSAQPSILYVFDKTYDAGTLFTLKDSSGAVLLSYAPDYGFNCVNLSTPELAVGSSYTLCCGDDEYSVQLDSDVYSNGSFGGMGGNGGVFDRGQGRRTA